MIQAENISVQFSNGRFKKKINALDGLNLTIHEGDFFALLGQNGAGKSTAMYCFLGLLKPTSGIIRVLGATPELGTDMYRDIAYLPEEPHYHLYMTIEEAVRYYGSLYGEGITAARLNDILERLGLAEFKSLRLKKCSKGMKQKMGLAQCLIKTPRLLFMDEPTRGLDPIVVKDLRDILVELNRSGTTIVMNSHILSEIELVANRVAIIHKGSLVVQDELANILSGESGTYAVEFEPGEDMPDYASEIGRTQRGVRCDIPSDRLYDFMDYTRINGLKLYSCSMKKASLEDTYIRIIRGESPNA